MQQTARTRLRVFIRIPLALRDVSESAPADHARKLHPMVVLRKRA
jgi:hypothetical protein